MTSAQHTVGAVLAAVATLAPLDRAVADDPVYRRPSQAIVDVLEASPLPSVSIDPTRRVMLMSESPSMPSIADLAQPMLRLAGRRINPATNGLQQTMYISSLSLQAIDGNEPRAIELPAGARIGSPQWAPDGTRFAFTITRDDGIELWAVHTETGDSRRLVDGVNGIAGGFSWMPDGRQLLVHLVPDGRGAAPERSAVPPGPIVQESRDRVSPVRTYQDLLGDTHDEALFEHYFTSQLAVINTDTLGRTDIGGPAIYRGASVSPDGRYLLAGRVERPYSYMVPVWSFPYEVDVLDLRAGTSRHIAAHGLADEVPIGGVVDGPRGHRWRSLDSDSMIVWIEALDGGDPKAEVPQRDRVMQLAAPFDGEPQEIARLEDRFRDLTWVERSSFALVSEYDRDERWTRTWMINAAGAETPPRLVFERSIQDRYDDPGRFVMTTNRAGNRVAQLSDGWLHLSGRGASPEGDRPFLDRMSAETLRTERLWRAEGECYEQFIALLSADRILTRFETPVEPPNYFVRGLGDGSREAVTAFDHPAPQLRDIEKELVTYERQDGVQLSATLYLPPGHEPGDRHPLLVWAYPLEYNNPQTASQVSGSSYRFTSIRGSSHLFMLMQGYAIMDRATMPIVGPDPETVNDTFIEQIVMSAQAAIDYAADRGVGDPERVGVGGHSYGAFMTANLLAHCDLFRAGVARSGAYNRTLTPFGFQSERRTFWEAPEVYFELSPFMHADTINEPLLLIHGQRDNNSGTFPIQSERLYHAVKGHGGTVRLVMLPYESHGYRARESVMHVLAEMGDWFDEHVKGVMVDPVGSWEMISQLGDRAIEATMTLMMRDGQLVGTWQSQGMDMPLHDLRIEGDRVRFERHVDDEMILRFDGTIDGDEITGTYTGPFGEIPSKGRRGEF